jgi:acyl-coenzyme A synthetase/AMP-(fatty) acid ligase
MPAKLPGITRIAWSEEDAVTDIVETVLGHAGGGRPAIVSPTETTSYDDLADLTRRLAVGLRQSTALGPDMCLVISHPGLEQSLALALAGWSIGARVAILPPYLTERELDVVIEKCKPVVRVSDHTADGPSSLGFQALAGFSAKPLCSEASQAWLQTFTSGTTGVPKCVDRRVSRLGDDVAQLASVVGFSAGDRVTAMTTALSTTSVLPALFAGSTLVLTGLRSARQFWADIGEAEITVISGTPYAYELAARHTPERATAARVRVALSTSARLRPSTAARFMNDTGIPVRNILCSSESGHIAYNDADDRDLLAWSVGRELPHVEVEIRDEHGAAVDDGEQGRICVRSAFTASRYRNEADETAAVFQDGWVVSSDIGFRDADGFLQLTGRNDHKIHFGAAKIDPQELEDVLLRHPKVTDVIVVGEDHARLGQLTVARVVPAGTVTSEELLAHCRGLLSAMKVPQRIEFVTEVPRDFKGQPKRPSYVRFGAKAATNSSRRDDAGGS